MNGVKSVQKKTKEEFLKQNLRPTVKHSGEVITVWGSMVYSGTCNMEFIDYYCGFPIVKRKTSCTKWF